MPLCSELMSRPKKAVAGYRPERTTPGGPSRAGRGRQYCKLRWLLSPKPEFSKCIFELKMPRPVIWQRFTSTNSCHEPPLPLDGRWPASFCWCWWVPAKHATYRSVVLTTRRLAVAGGRSQQGPAGGRLVTGGVGGSDAAEKAPSSSFGMIFLMEFADFYLIKFAK